MVLLGDKIKEKIKTKCLIIDPEYENDIEENFKSLEKLVSHASYNIRVGKKAVVEAQDETIELKDYEEIVLKPFEVAIIETYEKVKIPEDLIARWNIRVSLAYKGLIWVGGPQVDPGYHGHLYCPIYNMSDREVRLEYKEPIATMDFVQTTEPTEKSTQFNKEVKPFEAYKKYKLKSALTTHVKDKLKEIDRLEKQIKDFEKQTETKIQQMQTVFLTIVSILFIVLSVIITTGSDNSKSFGNYFSYVALSVALFSLILNNKKSFSFIKYAFKFNRYKLIFWTIFLIQFAFTIVSIPILLIIFYFIG